MQKKNDPVWPRFVFLAFAGTSVLTGLFAAVVLLGFLADSPAAGLAADHGPLMIFGFVGGAIGLERAVAVRTTWAWAGPALSAAGVVTLLAGLPRAVPAAAFALSFLVLGAIYARIHRRQPTLAVLIQAAGVIGGVAAATIWGSGAAFAHAVPFVVVYTVATIIGERVELARVSFAGASAESRLTALILALTAASLVFVVHPPVGFPLMGGLLFLIAVSAARVDVARRLVKSQGLPRFSSVCMLAGYAWLAGGGVIWLAFGHAESGFVYDAGVHAVFLGFVISMIFAHAPIILTSVIRRTLPYHRVMYVPVTLLHGGLALRVIGDARGALALWQTGGLVNVAAVLAFLATAAGLTVRHSVRKRERGGRKVARV